MSVTFERLSAFLQLHRVSDQAILQGKRFKPLDIARGLSLVWMAIAHTLSVSGAGVESWLLYLYLPGWSTTNFVMLTGFALAILSKATTAKKKIENEKRWRRRALQLLLVAYLSNGIFTIFKIAQGSGALTIVNLWEVVSLQYPWTISSILLPTVVLLAIAGRLERLVDRLGPALLLLALTVVEALLWQGQLMLPPSSRASFFEASLFNFDNAWFGFPLGTLFLLGVWAYGVGALFRDSSEQRPMMWMAFLLIGAFYLATPATITLPMPIPYVARFGLTLLGSLLILNIPGLGSVTSGLGLLGRSSLLVFILHRIFIQLSELALLFVIPPVRAPMILALTLALCAASCLYKESHPKVAGVLKRVGF